MRFNWLNRAVLHRFLERLPRSRRVSQATPAFSTALSAKLLDIARQDVPTVLRSLDTSPDGLTEEESRDRLEECSLNEIAREKPPKWYIQFLKTFHNPLVILLISLAIISWVKGDLEASAIILMMVIFSVILRFSQEFRSSLAAEKLREMVRTTATVSRRELSPDISSEVLQKYQVALHSRPPKRKEIPIKFLVPGDIIYLSAGDMIPADVRLISAKDLFISQGALTGESLPVEKQPTLPDSQTQIANPLELANICFLGTTIVSGTVTAVLVETGSNTYLGAIAKTVVGQKAMTSFDRGVNDVSLLLLRFMLVIAPAVFPTINGFLKGNWTEAFFFALSVAVGLTPDMLPMIVTANLARGAIAMSEKKVIFKNIDSIQSFDAMDILCTDKTGTLAQDRIVLEMHLDINGEESEEVLELLQCCSNRVEEV
ncbi:MAG: ATPase P [Hydrococcus sp. C42_A2020_068]|nr:cation-transporting P-type ATPase [Pleurocapsa sp. PCC 7327]AFY78954.1 cation transport ATPase [Pleurocapsa sp. PCC 7327]MBF2019825.1 ATPase P [Hydrococcus sp. C42_A2020_068]